ncbi:(2Fe-2S) ferredoxin domain-containing protein [Natronoarchaeum rubrum]|uniref:(2Fe-2S) ferredoxin domain-containing protein n=1 Tax=Natronoarchaeum rubrum TaxID=755311 RepID=UPI002112DC58|nr:(2Fe-2S) ferredoxin domain-containing protein [Natronoarchaeum rubrum]
MRRCTDAQRDRGLTWVLVCTNARDGEHAACAEAGGDAIVDAATDWLRERDLFWTEAAVVETSCLGLCSEDGAAVGFQPRDEWYADVRPEDVPELLAEELVDAA